MDLILHGYQGNIVIILNYILVILSYFFLGFSHYLLVAVPNAHSIKRRCLQGGFKALNLRPMLSFIKGIAQLVQCSLKSNNALDK